MNVLNSIHTCSSSQSIGSSKTIISLCTAAHENGSYTLILNSLDEPQTATSSSGMNGSCNNVVGVYKLTDDNNIVCRHEFVLPAKSNTRFEGRCITATSPYYGGRNNSAATDQAWVIIGGSVSTPHSSASSPAVSLCPLISSSDKSIGQSTTIIEVPTTSGAKNSAVSHAAFISLTEAALATTDGRFAIFDIERACVSSPGDDGLGAVPGLTGMKPTSVVAAEDPNSFFVSSGRLVARIDVRTPGAFTSHRPAQMWLWHPHDRVSALNFESFTTSRELVCGSNDGTVMLFDTRSPQQNANTSFSSSSSSASAASPWQVTARPGTSISGIGRISGSICVAWNDGIIGAIDVVSAPTSESKSTIRVISKNDDSTSTNSRNSNVMIENNNEDAPPSFDENRRHQLLSTPSHEFAHDSAVADNSGSVILSQEKGLAIVGSRRGKVSVVGYR